MNISGVLDEDILDIDWFEVMSGFRVALEKRLIDNKDIVLDAIKLAIDGIIDEDMSCVDRESEKDKYADSADAWVKHGVRMIRAVVSRCLTKVGSYWEALNFLPPGALKSSVISNGTNKSALFANTASLYTAFGGATAVGGDNSNSQSVGIHSFLHQVLKSSSGNEVDNHMNNLIQYTKIPRDKYKIIPATQARMENWLLETVGRIGSTTDNKTDDSTIVAIASPCSPNRSGGDAEQTTSGSKNDVGFEQQVIPASPTTSIDSSGGSCSEMEGIGNSAADKSNIIDSKKMQSLTVSLSPILLDYHNLSDSVKFHMKELLKILYAGVCGRDSHMCLKINAINNSRNGDCLMFMKFLENNKDKHIEQLVINFEESIYFKNFTSSFFIPFSRADRGNIIGDGYCFYRTLYILYIRSQDGAFELSAEDMKLLDYGLRNVENDVRAGFYNFFDLLHSCLPEEYGKSRVLQSRFLFFHIMNCSLDQRFWGVMDGIAYLPFECCGFGEHDDPVLSDQWVKYYCTSLFRDSVESRTIGTSPTFADINSILQHHPNFAMFKTNHFFVSEHRTRLDMQTSFELCMENILSEFQIRFNVASDGFLSVGTSSSPTASSDAVNTWCALCDRMELGTSTQSDVESVRAATELLVHDLQQKQVVLEEEAEKMKDNTAHKKRKLFSERAPLGATEDQKKLFSLTTKVRLLSIMFVDKKLYETSHFNCIMQYKDAKQKLMSLQSELDGIKRMIQKNLIAKENTIVLCENNDDSDNKDQTEEELSIIVVPVEETETVRQLHDGSSFLVMSQQDRGEE
jgi:hypothetical protein